MIAPGEMESYGVAEALSTGAAVAVWGDVVPSPAKGQAFEASCIYTCIYSHIDIWAFEVKATRIEP